MLYENNVYESDFFDLCAQMSDQSVDMVLCDLPYGTTRIKWDSVIPLDEMWRTFRRIVKPSGAIVLTAGEPFTSTLITSNRRDFRYRMIWKKNRPQGFFNANRRPLKSYEDVCVFYRRQPTYNPQMRKGEVHGRGARGSVGEIYGNAGNLPLTLTDKYYPIDVMEFDVKGGLHPTQKPVALFRYLIRTYTQPGELVFDPCVGSGTTAVAALREGRRFIVGDQSAEYVGITCERLISERFSENT